MKALIIVIVIVVLGMVAATIIVGTRSFEGIVTERPYEKGLLWDRNRKEKMSLGWKVAFLGRDLHTGKNELVLSVIGRGGTPIQGAEVSVVVSRPSTTAFDRTYPALPSPDGLYRAVVVIPSFGYWDLRTTVFHAGNHVTFEERVYVNKGGAGK